MQAIDKSIPHDFIGQSIFARLKYLCPTADVSNIPAILWLIEQLAPTQILGVNLSSTTYLALCQALEKANNPEIQINALHSFADDSEAFNYHQQQYQEFSKILTEPSALKPSYDLILIATPTAITSEQLSLCSSPNTIVVLLGAVAPELENALNASYKQQIAFLNSRLFINNSELERYSVLQQLPTYLNKLRTLFTFVENALNERLKLQTLARGSAHTQALQQSINSLTADKSLLEHNVEQQASQIQRQQAELAMLARTQQQATELCQEYQQKLQQEQALLQQLEQQFSTLQKMNSELAQRLNLRDTELASLTTKLVAQEAEQAKYHQLEKQLAAANLALHNAQQLAEQQQIAAQEQQYQARFNEMEKQRYLQDFKLFETQRALHNYQQEVIKLTAIVKQLSKNLEREQHRQNQLKQQIQQLKNRKIYKLLHATSRLTKVFGNNKPKQQLERQKALIVSSNLFDEQWYLTQYPDVAAKQLDPVIHYLKFGGFEGRKPNSNFDSQWYITTYPDVAEQGINPLLHFIKFGQYENRATQAEEQ